MKIPADGIGRRATLKTLSTLPMARYAARMPAVGSAAIAEFKLSFASVVPATHPLNLRMQEAAERVAKEINGRAQIKIFPNYQFGGDSDMFAQVRNGTIAFFPYVARPRLTSYDTNVTVDNVIGETRGDAWPHLVHGALARGRHALETSPSAAESVRSQRLRTELR